KLNQGQKQLDKLFYLPAYLTVLNQLNSYDNLVKVEMTSPLFLSSICDAVGHYNEKKEKNIYVDLYLLETPHHDVYYFRALQLLDPKQRKLIRLFTLPPIKKDLKKYDGVDALFWREQTGLEMDQIIYEPIVNPYFKNKDNPVPGSNTTI